MASEYVCGDAPKEKAVAKYEYSEGFEKFWAAWPRHPRKTSGGKAKPYELWRRYKLEKRTDDVIRAVKEDSKVLHWSYDNQFVPLPATWLCQRRYERDAPPVQPEDCDPRVRKVIAKTAEQQAREMADENQRRLAAFAEMDSDRQDAMLEQAVEELRRPGMIYAGKAGMGLRRELTCEPVRRQLLYILKRLEASDDRIGLSAGGGAGPQQGGPGVAPAGGRRAGGIGLPRG